LSHKTRRYGRWGLMRFINDVGTSQFVCFSERNAAAFTLAAGGDPRQDDYDIWLGTKIIKPWIAYDRHTQVANYLYLVGHAVSLPGDTPVIDMYPDKVVLSDDGSSPFCRAAPRLGLAAAGGAGRWLRRQGRSPAVRGGGGRAAVLRRRRGPGLARRL